MSGVSLSMITMIIMKEKKKKNQNNNKKKQRQKKKKQYFMSALFEAALKENTEREYALIFKGSDLQTASSKLIFLILSLSSENMAAGQPVWFWINFLTFFLFFSI